MTPYAMVSFLNSRCTQMAEEDNEEEEEDD